MGGLGAIMALAPAWLVFCVIHVVSKIYYRRSFNGIATAFNANLFKTTGLVELLGAILTIILIGIVISLLGSILGAIAFFTMPEQPVVRTIAAGNK
jgi:uncharacterized membrane protein